MTTLVTHFEKEFGGIACKHDPDYIHLPLHEKTHLELNAFDHFSIKYNKIVVYVVIATKVKITKTKELFEHLNGYF